MSKKRKVSREEALPEEPRIVQSFDGCDPFHVALTETVQAEAIPKGEKDRRIRFDIDRGIFDRCRSWVCLIWADSLDPDERGTGWLAGPRLVVTAGHVIQNASRFFVIPGCAGSSNGKLIEPYGNCIATSLLLPDQFPGPLNVEFDFGFIVLPESFPLGNQLGWFNVSALPTAVLVPDRVGPNIAGFPAEKPFEIWASSGTIQAADEHLLWYNIHTTKGQSGAPVWYRQRPPVSAIGLDVNEEISNTVVGIHTGRKVRGKLNSGTRITSEIVRMINALNENPNSTPPGLRRLDPSSGNRNVESQSTAPPEVQTRNAKLARRESQLLTEFAELLGTLHHCSRQYADQSQIAGVMLALDTETRKSLTTQLDEAVRGGKFASEVNANPLVMGKLPVHPILDIDENGFVSLDFRACKKNGCCQ